MNRSTGTPRPVAPAAASPERRDFLQACATVLAGITVVGVVSPLLSGCEPTTLPTPAPRTGDPGTGGGATAEGVAFDVSMLDSDGKSVATDIKGPDGFPILIIRSAEATYSALSMRCTHESCAVEKSVPIGGPILCRCHGSLFNLDGSVRRGPAVEPLARYTTTFDPATSIVRIKVS